MANGRPRAAVLAFPRRDPGKARRGAASRWLAGAIFRIMGGTRLDVSDAGVPRAARPGL